MTSNNVSDVTDEEFQTQVLDSNKPTLVDFWADWCGPCRALAPMIHELAIIYSDRINFKKLNIDKNNSTPIQFGIKGVPTLILFKDGKIVDQIIGVAPRTHIESVLQKVL